jgi:tRNA (guanine37-N1)-methyltransferase
MPVPDVLLSGDHAAIARWRHDEAARITRERRPDLLDRAAAEEGSG